MSHGVPRARVFRGQHHVRLEMEPHLCIRQNLPTPPSPPPCQEDAGAAIWTRDEFSVVRGMAVWVASPPWGTREGRWHAQAKSSATQCIPAQHG